MNLAKASSAEEVQIIGQYEGLRTILLSDAYRDHLDRPLAYWALPADRRLPLAFLGRTLRELLNTPFETLSASPGIGQRKLASFVTLLARAANTDPTGLPADLRQVQTPAAAHADEADANGLQFDAVSEVVWDHWRTSVVRHGLGGEKLGRFAPSLRHMTRVIWNRSLGEYANQSLAQIRALKTHGEKRVRAVLSVFHSLHALVAQMGTQRHLVVRIVPRLIDQIERWVERTLQTPGVPTEEELFENYTRPLLEQVRVDANDQLVRLAEIRLGLNADVTSVRQVARQMSLTRARVYQLLNEINDIIVVRWPNGRHLTYELLDKLQLDSAGLPSPPDLRQFTAAVELFYPGSRRGAAGPVERTEASEAAELVGVE